jgi:hypothetical protein
MSENIESYMNQAPTIAPQYLTPALAPQGVDVVEHDEDSPHMMVERVRLEEQNMLLHARHRQVAAEAHRSQQRAKRWR